jgi:hypothetical protein
MLDCGQEGDRPRQRRKGGGGGVHSALISPTVVTRTQRERGTAAVAMHASPEPSMHTPTMDAMNASRPRPHLPHPLYLLVPFRRPQPCPRHFVTHSHIILFALLSLSHHSVPAVLGADTDTTYDIHTITTRTFTLLHRRSLFTM